MKSFWFKNISRRLQKSKGIRATARIFVPSVGKRLIVVPFSTISIIPIVVLLIASGYLFIRSDIFLVKNVNVMYTGGIPGDELFANGFVTKEAVLALVEERALARSVLNIQLSGIEEQIASLDPIIDKVKIKRKLPDSLEVNVMEKKVVALLVVERREENAEKVVTIQEEYYLIDTSGVLARKVPQTVSLPQFRYQTWIDSLDKSQPLVGVKLPEGVLEPVLQTIQSIQEQSEIIANAYMMVDDFTINVLTKDNIVVVLTFEKSIEEQIDSVVVVLDQLKSGDRKVRRIDARFDKIFVEYE